jgi:signal transduction histidine kinase
MLVMTDLLNTEELDQDKRILFTRNLTLQLKRMEWLLTSLLKIAKIDAGTIEFKKESVNVEKLIKHSLKPLLIPLELKNQEFIMSGETTVSFNGDFNWSSEALINIIKNCIEHTPDSGTISVHYSENPMYTEIIVSDNGTGIDKEDLPYIFKRFYKGKNANDDSVGIGLAMAKSIINSQNGDIIASSTVNQGTTFRIKFFKQII